MVGVWVAGRRMARSIVSGVRAGSWWGVGNLIEGLHAGGGGRPKDEGLLKCDWWWREIGGRNANIGAG